MATRHHASHRASKPDLAGTVGDVPRLINAMDRFCSGSTHFESSTLASVVREEMAASADINQAALVPLRHAIFGFETALRWGFFLMNAVPAILSEDGGSLSSSFDIVQYNTELVSIYDLAAETAVWDFCEEDEESVEDE